MSDWQNLNRNTAHITNKYPERIVQFGAGNFLRGFTDWAIQVLNDTTDFNGGVVVVKVTHGTYTTLDAQDGLFHVHLAGLVDGEFRRNTQLNYCIQRAIYAHEWSSYLELAKQADIRFLFSNTTEAGIRYIESDDYRDAPPESFPAKLTQFLYTRYQHFVGDVSKGCIIIPTELIIDNGTQLKEMILRYAQQWELESKFTDWINEHNLFCNTLVDRIVTGYPDSKTVTQIQQNIGFNDELLVMGEPYYSWIIEAPQQLKEELPVEGILNNIKIVDDVEPYRKIKVRILNGLHSSMVPIGYLLGIETVGDAMQHPELAQFLQNEAYQEIVPVLNLPSDDLTMFANATFDRFRNPAIHHKLLSIALNSISKLKTRILPTIFDYVEKYNALPSCTVLAMACYIRFYKGDWQGQTIPLNDDANTIAWFAEQWQNNTSTAELVEIILKNTQLWGRDLTEIDGLSPLIVSYIDRINVGELQTIIKELNG